MDTTRKAIVASLTLPGRLLSIVRQPSMRMVAVKLFTSKVNSITKVSAWRKTFSLLPESTMNLRQRAMFSQ